MPLQRQTAFNHEATLFSRKEATRLHFIQTREATEQLMAGLSDADASVQAMPDASPAKWHLAHTTWFFETFVLRENLAHYALFDADFPYLFNSYYEAEGPRLARHLRGLLTRPTLAKVLEYRHHVSAALLACLDDLPDQALEMIELGCNHEEQHQELLQTDVLYLFSCNPLLPPWRQKDASAKSHIEVVSSNDASEIHWIEGKQGAVLMGHDGDGFSFDCEGPRHTTWLSPHALSNRLVCNREWLAFIEAGGYRDPALWLADGWAWVNTHGIDSPLHWQRDAEGAWDEVFSPYGKVKLQGDAPVTHVSYFEADAFARWYGARLPTEAEWESAAERFDPEDGHFLDANKLASPQCAAPGTQLQQMFGALWQWTGSAYLPYPGFRSAPGAVGEYNGKFMSGQFVLRGGSCATPRGHVRASYRNFFYPHQRWQFTGVRLAKDL